MYVCALSYAYSAKGKLWDCHVKKNNIVFGRNYGANNMQLFRHQTWDVDVVPTVKLLEKTPKGKR